MALVESRATTEAVRRSLSGRRSDVGGSLFQVGLLATLLLALATLVVLLVRIFSQGWSVFAGRGAGFLTDSMSSIASRAGVWQGISGSLTLMVFVVAIAFPVGVGAAVYLEEYARDTWFARFVNANIRNLAGVPSIVYGLLGLAIFVKFLGFGRSVIAGGLTLAVLVLPIVIITTAEALRAVPNSIREAGYGVGATKWEVVRSHVLPYAAPGIFTGTVLSIARAFGETAPLLLVGAVQGTFFTGSQTLWERLQGPYTSLPTIIYTWSRQPNPDFQELTAAAIMVLLVVLLMVNATAIMLRNRYERR